MDSRNITIRAVLSKFVFFSSFFLILSCTGNLNSRVEKAYKLADTADFQQVIFNSSVFKIVAWKRFLSAQQKTFIIYIEGDGNAWLSRYKPSKDPTPKNPMALRLAIQDERENIIYLSRPCQFMVTKQSHHCQEKYWTSHRYAKEVVDAYDEILDKIKSAYHVKQFELIGFSGGGLIAALIAAQRSDISLLTTIAANLDHAMWTAHHKVSPLTGSMELYPFIAELAYVKQIHLFGSKDVIVPFSVNKTLIERLADKADFYFFVYPDFDHFCCWSKDWAAILKKNQEIVGNTR